MMIWIEELELLTIKKASRCEAYKFYLVDSGLRYKSK